jgi:hypothetical protein
MVVPNANGRIAAWNLASLAAAATTSFPARVTFTGSGTAPVVAVTLSTNRDPNILNNAIVTVGRGEVAAGRFAPGRTGPGGVPGA